MQKTVIITEEDVRTYLYCGEFYSRGGRYERPNNKWCDKLLELAFGNTMQTLILQPGKFMSIELLIAYATDEAISEIPEFKALLGDETKTHRLRIIQLVYEALELFQHKSYQVVAGPCNYNVKVGDQTIELRFGGMFINTHTKTLHTVSFSHYPSYHSEANDPMLALKVQFVMKHLTNQYKIKHIAHHVFAFGHDKATNNANLRHKLLNNPSIPPKVIRYAESIINNISSGISHPALPCPNSTCTFYKTCYPEYWK